MWKNKMDVTFAIKLPHTKGTYCTRKYFHNKMTEGLAFGREYIQGGKPDAVIMSRNKAPNCTPQLIRKEYLSQFHIVLQNQYLEVDGPFVFNTIKVGESRTTKGSMTLGTNADMDEFLEETAADLRNFGVILQKKAHQRLETDTVIAFLAPHPL